MGCIGPTSYLPGDIYAARGEKCQKHENLPAVKVLVGETDRLGAETIEMCQQCYDAYEKEKEAQKAHPDPSLFSMCDSCGKTDASVRAGRDPDEGTSGPVYYWCSACRREVNEYHSRGHGDD